MKRKTRSMLLGTALTMLALAPRAGFASSHMDAPLITRDPSANTTDVYAFLDQDGEDKSLVVALGVYPFEEPGIGPNKFNFDENVLYEIHIATGADVAAGRASISYQFQFQTTFANTSTILQSYLGVITNLFDSAQNLRQTYTVTKVDRRGKKETVTVLGSGRVPPNNQGIATPFYNQGNDGDNPARQGVTDENDLDQYTKQAITNLSGYTVFAGQRDDGFYSDIQGVFDLLQLGGPNKPFDSQGGFNLHLMALEIPIAEIGGTNQTVGVFATTSRQSVKLTDGKEPKCGGKWVQVARQGNPLFNEGLVAIVDKDLYSRTTPETDSALFRKYAETPELAALINAILLGGTQPIITTGRTDIAGIYIPDLIKVDLSTTTGARLTSTGGDDPGRGFSRLSVFGGDVLTNSTGSVVAGGWPNGRRFGDDVVDIAISAILAPLAVVTGDSVTNNDVSYSTVFPYESTPQNGRNHGHHGN